MNTWLSRTLNNPKNSELPPLLHVPYTTTHITHSSSAPELTATRHCSIQSSFTQEIRSPVFITKKESNSIHIYKKQNKQKLQMLKRLPFKIATWIYLNKSVAAWWKIREKKLAEPSLRCWDGACKIQVLTTLKRKSLVTFYNKFDKAHISFHRTLMGGRLILWSTSI